MSTMQLNKDNQTVHLELTEQDLFCLKLALLWYDVHYGLETYPEMEQVNKRIVAAYEILYKYCKEKTDES